ncbi:type VI secretion system lysozyme-like protein [Burkholderia lata]|uniref:type VI secretion system baseplate subunit TssE n=1 Tax=Burkholderia lata (strain ATCC 17760 / DSM 23089 / LMG 22485 / NCIMB 9086 / R18194 / 383) TaxID=482957 RepID=UPI00145496D3|nr:type VI secretion system baseplate subunit TssE [Burkholderia lata]VWC81108.1 type VI secretion system lysozyme-like protein [Burkholderia lata]
MTERKQPPARGNSLVARPPRRANVHLMPTLLDRLRDDAPHRLVEAPEEYAVTRKQMRDIVQRDLAYLLNTTSIEDRIKREHHPQAASSTVNFGVPPLAGTFLASRQWNDIEQMIRKAITDFEPRLIPDSLVVTPREDDAASGHHNVLAFEVRGLVHMDPYPLEFMVQSSLDLDTSEIQITGMRSG